MWHRKCGAFRLSVHRHIHHGPNVWLFSCDPVASGLELKAQDIEQAKSEAELFFVRALSTATAVIFPECDCNGGDQGDGLCATPHEPHCATGQGK